MPQSTSSEFGHRFIVEPAAAVLSAAERDLLSELRPAGVMFRKRNFLADVPYEEWLPAYRRLVEEIRQAVGREHLILCIDHEGGRVIRPPEPVTRFPYAAHWCDRTVEVARAMAIELRSLGINVMFGPVADIHSNPQNPVINERAFGRTAEEVLAGALPFADTIMQCGLSVCPKHFPGHGDTQQDSHHMLPVVDVTLAELRARELIPFRKIIDRGVPMMMTAHLLLPQIDPDLPATFSRALLVDLLRGELGFRGVVIADALGMAAVWDKVRTSEGLLAALHAELDLFLMGGDAVSIEDAIDRSAAIALAAREQAIIREILERSRVRIETLLATLPQYAVEELPAETFAAHRQLAEDLNARAPWGGFDLHVPGFE